MSLPAPALVWMYLPWGFSYGDYLRCGSIAAKSKIIKSVIDFANSGGLVIGIKMANIIFEQIGYKVQRIDRVFFAGLSKKDLPRKQHRFLSNEEISLLKRL